MGASGRRCWAATLTLGAVALVTLILARTGSKRPPPERPPPSPGPAAQPGPEADLPGPRLAAEPDICSELQERSTSCGGLRFVQLLRHGQGLLDGLGRGVSFGGQICSPCCAPNFSGILGLLR
jgi:hypothetical protein